MPQPLPTAPDRPTGRDEHLLYRFVDADYAPYCTSTPLRFGQIDGQNYQLLLTQEDQP